MVSKPCELVESITIPLFPLRTVLFPDGYLPLRVFEPRYLDMVRECCAGDSSFGVCLADIPSDSNKRATHTRVGTLAKIRDWSTLEDGLLGITAQGGDRFAIQSTRTRDNGLLIGEVEIMAEPEFVELPEQYSVLSMIAGRFMEQLSSRYPEYEPAQLQDSNWVGYRLAELLPLENLEKQVLLQLDRPMERLQKILELLSRFQIEVEN